MSSPFTIGIDLGTTHSAISAIEIDLSEGDSLAKSDVGIPQLVAPGQVEARPLASVVFVSAALG
jgi:molecular chaperone DnaK (HSP70)